MLTETHVLVVAPIAVVVVAFLFLNRKLDLLLQRSSSSSSAAAVPADKRDFVLLLQFAAAVAVLALALIYAPSASDVRALAEAWGFVDSEASQQPLGVWVTNGTGLRYQLQPFDLANKTRYPVIECAAYPHAEDLHQRVLGDLPDVKYDSNLDPSLQKEKAENRRREERLRSKARQRCVLNPEEELVSLHPDRMTYLTLPNQPSLIEVVRENALLPDALSLHSPVDHVLVARDGSRFYRVAIVIKNTTAKKGVSLAHRLVEERDLLAAPRAWYRKFCDIKGFDVYPCICPAHYGILNSGFYFHYDDTASPTEDHDCNRPWRLWTNARIVRPVAGTTLRNITMTYHPYPTDFPLRVMEKLNFSTFDNPDMSTVEYVDMARLFESATIVGLLDILDPDWITHGASVNRSLAPLLSVMPIDRLVGRDGVTGAVFGGNKNACFGYCLNLDQTILQDAGVTVD